MILGTDFIFRDDLFNSKEEGSTVPIELKLDPYKGIVYRYTAVKFKLDEDNVPRLLYAYEIIDSKKSSELQLRRDARFQKVLGLILNTLMLDVGETEQDENRNNNTKEPNQEGGLHEEGPSVSEG